MGPETLFIMIKQYQQANCNRNGMIWGQLILPVGKINCSTSVCNSTLLTWYLYVLRNTFALGKRKFQSLDPHLLLIYSATVYVPHVTLSLLPRHMLAYPLAISHYCMCCYEEFHLVLRAEGSRRTRGWKRVQSLGEKLRRRQTGF